MIFFSLFIISTVSLKYSQCKIPYCAECDETGNKCLQCYQGHSIYKSYMLVNGKCEYKGKYGCNDFSGDSCTSCAHGYKRYQNKTSGKMICKEETDYCDFYSSETLLEGSEFECSQCVEGYAIEVPTNGESKRCIDFSSYDKYCRSLKQFEKNTCDRCMSHFKFDNNKKCVPEDEFCNSYSISSCSGCVSGYVLNGVCQRGTIKNCLTYSSTGKCSKCVNGISLLNGKCSTFDEACKDLPNCEMCYLSTDKKTVNCEQCAEGYCHKNGECVKCPVEKCKKLSDSDSTKCITCKFGYRLTNNACEKCKVDGCSRCTSDINKCTSCLNKKVLIENQCKDCDVENCEKGFSEYSTDSSSCICTKCKSNAYMTVGNKCITKKIEHCNKYYDDGKCYSCESGYTQNSDKTKCEIYCNSLNNQKTANVKCISCSSGYYLTKDYTCEKCDVKKCNNQCVHDKNTCLSYYNYDIGCSYFNKDHQCLKCKTGFTLKNGECQPNVLGCVEFSATGKCVLCQTKSGRQYLANEKFECPEKYDDVDNNDNNGNNKNESTSIFILMISLIIIFFF